MVIKKIVKRIASTILAVAITATTITGTFASAAIDPNPISTTPTNISFSFTEGHISATSVRNVYGVRAAGASLTQYTKLTHTQDFWIIHPNNQTYSNLCINPNTTVNAGTQPYYAYQVTSGSMEANSSYWGSLAPNVKKTIGLIMHYGYPNGNKGGFAMGGGQDSHGAACFEATQMLVWEAVSGMRVLPSDYDDRDRASGFYHSYASTQWHYTNGKADYKYSPLIDFFTKSDATMVQNTINYYKWLVDKIAHHIDIPENTYEDDTIAKANPITLKYNSTTKRYEASFTTNEALFEDIGARTAIGNVGLNVTKQGATAANGNATYVVHTAKYFSGTKVTAKMEKSSTKQHANETGRDGLQIWAGKYTATETGDLNIQQNVTGSFSDPARAFMAFAAQEVRGDFTVVKKSVKSNGEEDAVLVESVRKDASFMVYDVAAERYIKTSIDAQGNYQYVSSDGYSNTSTNPGTIFKLNTEGKETTPTAYIVAEAQDNVSVEYAQTTELTFFNAEKTGSIKVQKRTEGDINLEGIEFTLSGKSTSGRDISITSKTDANGVAEFKNIPIGDYTVKESGGVNAAYIIAEPQKVTVLYAQETSAEFFNELKKGSIKVQKKTKDMTNIEGITFALLGKSDAGTDVNITGKTDANGVCEFKNIPVGTYQITESGVPAGYLVADPQSVTVLYAQTVEATFVNEEKPEKPSTPPQTGFNGGNSTTIMLLLISVGAISCCAFIGKRKEDK
ncbi:MAG: Cys-Gln thioester bond-forming surface protein [Ruminococcus sp.]|nr:Cys-Gln thioester bond-forming surface protein [Ruminococcus sp.]